MLRARGETWGGGTNDPKGAIIYFRSNQTTFNPYRGWGRFFPSPQVSPLALNIQPLSGLVNNHFVLHSIGKRYNGYFLKTSSPSGAIP